MTDIIPEINYTDRVFQYLLDMECTVIVIDDICKEETKKDFIEAVKLFIQYGYGNNFGFTVEFNQDYKKLRKFKI